MAFRLEFFMILKLFSIALIHLLNAMFLSARSSRGYQTKYCILKEVTLYNRDLVSKYSNVRIAEFFIWFI